MKKQYKNGNKGWKNITKYRDGLRAKWFLYGSAMAYGLMLLIEKL